MKSRTTSETSYANQNIANKSWMLRQLFERQAQIGLSGSSTFVMERARRVVPFTRILSFLLFGLFYLASATAAFAQSYASSAGYDGNPCTSAMPCRTVDRALATAPVGGSVILMDAGPYNPFTIYQSVNIIAATGTAPHIIAPTNSTPAIRIEMSVGESAYLEGLTISADKPGGVGVQWQMSSKLLWMKNCVVSDFDTGLRVTAGGNIVVDTCTFRNGFVGINMATRSEIAPIYATIQHSEVRLMRTVGINCGSNTDVGIRDCIVSQCGSGIFAQATNLTSGGSDHSKAYVTVTNSSVFKNGYGVYQDVSWSSPTRTVVRLGANMIYNNSGIGIGGGCDLGGNSVFGNGWPSIDEWWMSGHAAACPF